MKWPYGIHGVSDFYLVAIAIAFSMYLPMYFCLMSFRDDNEIEWFPCVINIVFVLLCCVERYVLYYRYLYRMCLYGAIDNETLLNFDPIHMKKRKAQWKNGQHLLYIFTGHIQFWATFSSVQMPVEKNHFVWCFEVWTEPISCWMHAELRLIEITPLYPFSPFQ